MIVVVIPAYQPERSLVQVVNDLRAQSSAPIVVVDDGSEATRATFFEQVARVAGVTVLRHAVNLGKGAALKTAFNYALNEWPGLLGVVTADADGQHLPGDILRVAGRLRATPDAVVLGARQFAGRVPLRSLIGNRLTSVILRLVGGQNLSDTQTGLRGIPRQLLPALLRLTSGGYEFELDMLLACKQASIRIVEEPIATVYLESNRSSHFNPLTDSLKIYFTLLRFGSISVSTTLLDNTVFWFFAVHLVWPVWQAQVAARVVAVVFNYTLVRKTVFLSKRDVRTTLPLYLGLVVVSGVAAYLLLQTLHRYAGFPLMLAKITAEVLLFFFNFLVQRDLIFTRRTGSPAAE